MLHAIRLNVPLTAARRFCSGDLTELPVSLMIRARHGGRARTFNSPNGLLDVLQRLAGVIDEVQANRTMSYRIDYAGTAIKGKKSSAPDVRVTRQNITVNVIFAPPETGDKK